MASGNSPLRNKVRKIGLLAALVLLAATQPGDARFSSSPELSCLALQGGILPTLRSGDLVFRTGRDLMARLILSGGTDTRFSHLGILHRTPLGLEVVHAMPEEEGRPGGVLVEPLEVFAAPPVARDLAFYRVEALDMAAAERVASQALAQRGKRFDAEFRYSDDRELYCTELALKALESEIPGLSAKVEPLTVPLIREPVFPPDHLRRLAGLRCLSEAR